MSLVFFDYVYTKHTFTSVVILESFLVLARALPISMDLLWALQVLFAVMIVLVSEGKSLFAEAYEDIFDAVHQQVEMQKREFWQVCPRPKSCAAKVSVLFVFRPCLWWWRYTLSRVLLFESYAKDSICHCNNYAVTIIYHLINITCSFSVNYPQIIANASIISAFSL